MELLGSLEHTEAVSVPGRTNTDLARHEVVFACVDGTFLGVCMENPLLLLNSCLVSSQRVHVCIFIVLIRVVVGKTTLIAMDVGITACAIRMVMNGFTGTALAATSRNMLRADYFHCWA